MSINLADLKRKLDEFDAKTKKPVKPTMSMAPGFEYTTSLFIGDIQSRIRLWLEQVDNSDSLIALNGAIDSFFAGVKHSHFPFTVKRGVTNGDDIVDVEGHVLSYRLMDTVFPTDKNKIEMTLYLKSYIAQPSLEYEIKNNCYFYLNGEIEGESHPGKRYNTTQDTFEDCTNNIITNVTFTTFSMYCARRKMKHELLTKLPF